MDMDRSEHRMALIGRAIAGAVAAFVVTFFVLIVIDYLPQDLDTLEAVEHQKIGLKVLIVSPFAGTIIGLVAGHRRVSLFWLWWAVLFGVTCCIPVFPSKTGSLLPLGTYFVAPFSWLKITILVTHLGVTALLAAVIHVFCRLGLRLWKRRDASATMVSQQDGG